MFDTSVGLMIHHPHKSFWHDFAPSYEYQLALPDDQIAIAMSFEPSILTSLFELELSNQLQHLLIINLIRCSPI